MVILILQANLFMVAQGFIFRIWPRTISNEENPLNLVRLIILNLEQMLR